MRVTSYREIVRVLKHPSIESSLFGVMPTIPPMGDDVFYLRPGTTGLMVFVRRDGHFDCHAAMLPGDTGLKPKIQSAIRWMVENQGMREMRSPINKDNRKARRMARECGMRPVEENGKLLIYRGRYG